METYKTQNDAIRKIIKNFHLTRTLYIASILIGEPFTGKRTLVRTLFPDLPRVDGRDQEAVEALLEQSDALVIEHYEKLPNADRLNFDGKHIIATADYAGNTRTLDETFAFLYLMPPLRERPEDIDLYTRLYEEEARQTLQVAAPTACNRRHLDLRENLRSLRASVYREVLFQSHDSQTLERGLYHYFHHTFDVEADYHRLLGIFEKPLLEAGLEKYGSQLRLAEALGINRNTLRKKIHERL